MQEDLEVGPEEEEVEEKELPDKVEEEVAE